VRHPAEAEEDAKGLVLLDSGAAKLQTNSIGGEHNKAIRCPPREQPNTRPPDSASMKTCLYLLTHRHFRCRLAFFGLMLMSLYGRAAAADGRSGEQVYRQQCASCHGAKGEGSDEYQKPLRGDRSVMQLARFIAKSMPKDSDKKCSPEDAQKVAAYVYDAFYSKTAQERNRPPRIELSRLTVRQYRQVAADLIGTFRSPARWDQQRGLKGEYYKSRRFWVKDERVIERVDPMVRFDFGVAGPEPMKFDPNQFSIRWSGSVLAPDTGEYEFIVRTEHAVRLWINDAKRPLIDAWVKSGNDREHRGSIFLVGGRAYPLRLEFSKAKQGVDDSKDKKKKKPEVKASIALEWKLPHRTPEVIPQRCLSPLSVPVSFVLDTAFPADDRSVGYERGTAISRAWEQATTDAAIEIADYLIRHLVELSGVRDDAANRPVKLRAFCARFAERAFRRPLTDEQKRLYVDRPFASTRDVDSAVKRSVLLVLKSPRFLYGEIGGVHDSYDRASRLAFALWDSLPDTELLQAAASGQLATREQLLRHAERMVSDPRTHAKLREFFLQWLKVDPAPELAKDPKQFPGFDAAASSNLRTSLELFLDDVLWSDASDFRQLFLADYLYLNGHLARLYGVDLPADASFQKLTPKSGERAGILTHPYLMAVFAYTATSSPIHRGVFLSRSVLGRSLLPPPEAFTPLPADLHPKLTTRERVDLQTRPHACQTCHGMINPLGYTLENFDAIGRFRDKEKDRPVDASGSYLTRRGEAVKFNGVRDLAGFLAGSDEVHEAFVEQLFHYLVKQPIRAYGVEQSATLRRFFVDNRCNVRKLMVEIAAGAALLPQDEKAKDLKR
jgi:cytochrome c553